MKLETDLERIKQLAEDREHENWDFRTYLKWHADEDQLDELVHRIYREVSAEIDCTACANCCAVTYTTLTHADIQRMAAGLSMPIEEFRKQYVMTNEEGNDVLPGLPCMFLENKRCTIYEYRPEECRSYPHLHKDEFTTRLINVVWNYEICPIVFNVYERLKDETGWRDKRKIRRQ